ncbi:MAG: cell division protein ZapE [Pseudomonadota bacterium]
MEKNSTPLEKYQADLQNPDFLEDAAQRAAVARLQDLYDEIVSSPRERQSVFSKMIFGKQAVAPIPGLYFWGGVGRGKTYLVDMFYDCLPFEDKRRMHFHRFMQRVHNERKTLQDEADPLDIIAANWAKQTRILCFDEFVVHDIADAVILVKLMQGLCDRGVTLVATSNVEPRRLYEGGLQRDLFLPAIDLIYEHCAVVNLDSGIDYRLRFLDRAQTWFTPADNAAHEGMRYDFEHLAPDVGVENAAIEIEGRNLQSVRRSDGVIWFEFAELCDGPRSQNDYLELARCFHSILISNIPILDRLKEDQAKRFINLVDVFYDHNIKLIVSAEAAVADIYTGTRNSFEFKRTRSRLEEMQSHDYLALQHITS